jgi:hypothetical protein
MAKKAAVKAIKETIWVDNKQWTVRFGKLNPGPGRPESIQSLFKVVDEKLPFEAINKVNAYLRALGVRRNGVYIAHDSMGYARYIVAGGSSKGCVRARKPKNWSSSTSPFTLWRKESTREKSKHC